MLFINIDGTNGVGKTTTVNAIVKNLEEQNVKVKFVHFHRRGTPIGDMIQKVLNSEVTLAKESLQMLYAADMLDFTQHEYRELSKEYDVLITDRYMTSGYAIGMAIGIPFGTLETFHKFNVKPNKSFILTADVNEISKRLKTQKNVSGQTGDIFETPERIKKIQEKYLNATEYLEDVEIVDVTESTQIGIERISTYILEQLEELNEKKEGLKKLSDYRKQWDLDKANGKTKQTGRGIR